MTVVIQAGKLTDSQIYCHGIDSEESTYARGPNRVDYIFVSDRLLPHIAHQGCEPFNARIYSDHHGIFLDLLFPGLFDRSPVPLAPIHKRNVIYNCPSHVVKYLSFWDRYIKDHSLLKRSGDLLKGERDDEAAITFDKDVTAGLLAADNQCKNFNRSPWSPTLHAAVNTKFILSRHLSQF
jgi:hypothetical protein